MRRKRFSLSQAAKRIGVSAITLKRWLLAKKVEEVERDRNGWRRFSLADIRRIKRFAEKTIPPKATK